MELAKAKPKNIESNLSTLSPEELVLKLYVGIESCKQFAWGSYVATGNGTTEEQLNCGVC